MAMTEKVSQFIAHRGLQCEYPENTGLAIQGALDAGARQIEIDIQFSRDGIPVIYHDATLARVSRHKGAVNDFTLAELMAIPAYEPKRFKNRFIANTIEPLSHITPFLVAYPDLHIYVELKDDAIKQMGSELCLKQIAQCLQHHSDRFTLIGFNIQAITQAKKIYNFNKVGFVLQNPKQIDDPLIETIADVLFVDARRLNISKVPQTACEWVIYEIDDPQLAQQWLDSGIAKIETFCIDRFLVNAD